MIFVTGDTHGGQDRGFDKLSSRFFREKLTKDDYVIICGDVGFFWDNESDYWLDWITRKPWTTLFVDGNHEPFPKLYSYPIEDKFGAPIRKINDSVYHMLRGEVYDIQGKSFFTFGGAESVDKRFRREGISWWPEELPTQQEYENGFRNLAKFNNEVDYIISHTPPYFAINAFGFVRGNDPVAKYLEQIHNIVKFQVHYCGHMHQDCRIGDVRFLYHDVDRIL